MKPEASTQGPYHSEDNKTLCYSLCPHCNTEQQIPFYYQGKTVKCLSCAQPYTADLNPNQKSQEDIRREQQRANETARQQNEAIYQEKACESKLATEVLALSSGKMRRSGWSIFLDVLGIISILIGMIGALMNSGETAFFIFCIFVGAGITCFFYSFLLCVFTDIRWLLSRIATNTTK